ncbi:MAG: hypothetical protein NXI20_21780 [bacterium]|nr:hypothetical protein [bacterium]
MKVGIIILCRFSSSRLPGKILKEIKGKPLLHYIVERVKMAQPIDEVIVATSDHNSDDPIEQECLELNVPCFRGDLNNVADRFLNCAKEFELDFAIRINGDNIFTSADIINEMLSLPNWTDFDFISNVKDRTFPTGLSVEIVNVNFYENIQSKLDTDDYREHVTLFFYQNESLVNAHHHYNTTIPEAKGMKLAVDTDKDFKFATLMIESMEKDHTEYGLKDLVKLKTELS